MIKVAHVIKGLELGGAETVLRTLAMRADPTLFRSEIFSLTSVGPIGETLLGEGIRVEAMDTSGLGYPAAILRLARLLRLSKPDVVQTWMYHADLIGGLAAKKAGIHGVVWALHAGSPPIAGASLLARLGLRTNIKLSYRLPRRIICCSHTTYRVHAGLGYDTGKMVVVPNGFELSAEAVRSRKDLGLPENVPLVIRVGRDHPDKDIPAFVRCISILRRARNIEAVLVGPGLDASNTNLVAAVRREGVEGKVHLLGPRADVQDLVARSEVAVSSSSGGEGLPMTLGEAMAAGTPVVATDVGDSALLINDPQRVVRPGDPQALAAAIERVLSMSPEQRLALGHRDRGIIADRWDLASMVDGYCDQYLALMNDSR